MTRDRPGKTYVWIEECYFVEASASTLRRLADYAYNFGGPNASDYFVRAWFYRRDGD